MLVLPIATFIKRSIYFALARFKIGQDITRRKWDNSNFVDVQGWKDNRHCSSEDRIRKPDEALG